LNGKDVVAAGSASLALSYLDPGSAAARAAQARALRHPYEFVAADALEVVRRWPEAGPVPEGTTAALLYLLLEKKNAHPDHRLKATACLAPLLRKEEVPAFHGLLKDKAPAVRLTAAAALAQRFGDKEAVALLRQALTSPDAAVRRQAAAALAKTADRGKEALPALSEPLADRAWTAAQQAA